MALTTLLALPSPPALRTADDRVRPADERTATLDAAFLRQRVLDAILGPTLGVDLIAVPLPPVTRSLTMTLPATRADAKMHAPVTREHFERQPVTTLGAELLAFHTLPLAIQPGRHYAPIISLLRVFAWEFDSREPSRGSLRTAAFAGYPSPGRGGILNPWETVK